MPLMQLFDAEHQLNLVDGLEREAAGLKIKVIDARICAPFPSQCSLNMQFRVLYDLDHGRSRVLHVHVCVPWVLFSALLRFAAPSRRNVFELFFTFVGSHAVPTISFFRDVA